MINVLDFSQVSDNVKKEITWHVWWAVCLYARR